MCGKIMTVLLIFVVLNCSMARYNGRLHCIVGFLPTCYKRKAATYFYTPGGTGLPFWIYSLDPSPQNPVGLRDDESGLSPHITILPSPQ